MSTSTPTVSGDHRVGTRSGAARFFSQPETGALIGAVAVFVLFMLVAPSFRSIDNTGTILYQVATTGMMAVPVALLMIGGEFDLSAGVAVYTASLTASIVAWQFSLNVWIGVLVSLVFALIVGWFNGWLLRVTRLPSFLVTLGTFFILQGINLAVTHAIVGGVTSPPITDIAGFGSAQNVFASTLSFGGLHLSVTIIFWLLLTAIGAIVLVRTKIGNWILASGGDQAAARAAGVPVDRVKTGLFMFVGFCAWLLGQHTLFNFSTVQTGQGVGDEFIFIIAAVVGGCLLTGGYGSVIGASLGALIYGMTYLGINYAGWNPDWLKAFLGVMLVGATIINTWVRRKAAER